MKSWKESETFGQEFAANEYVSVCTITIACDYKSNESIHNGDLVIPKSVPDFAGGEYRPCNHEFVVGANELQQYTFTHRAGGYSGNDLIKIPQTAYYQIQEDNSNCHATSVTADQITAVNAS